ncbi:uncharacterized protein RAG0_16331 [Rhynchosporium agropyri]|uniref:RING-type domain-containing protein n=1 Tax=Rhynchosporium agropyri TaxID=914238 RepID=A0A1E1LPV6_9HELO|nr:uncharacterized protein RAG0_16331 [Rhynchosporium agropyri]
MAIVWDPRATLGIYPGEFGFTCAGTTQKGFRCRNSFIRNQYLLQAGEILDTLSQYHLVWLISDEPRLLATLKTLSWLTLCPRWHQKPGRHNQTLTVTSHWLQVLRSAEKAPRRGWQTSIPTTPSLQLSPTTPTSSSAIHQSQLTAYAAIPSTATSFLPSYLPAPAASTATSHSRPSCTRTSMLVGTLKPSEPIRQTQAPQFNTGIILSGPIRATGDVTLNITLNSKAGSNITDPPRNSPGHLTPPVSPSQTRTPPCSSPPSPAASVSRRTPLATFSSSVSTSNQAFTHHNIEALLARIDNLEIQLQQVTSRRSSRSSRSSGSSFSTGMFTPISSAINSVSAVSVSSPLNRSNFFLSPLQSPTPLSRPRSLSISTDTSTSPSIMTPSTSGPSSPALSTTPLSPNSSPPTALAWLNASPHPTPTHPSISPATMTPTSSTSSSPTLRTSQLPPNPLLEEALTGDREPRPVTSLGRKPVLPSTSCHMCRLDTSPEAAAQCLGVNGCRQKSCTLCLSEWSSSMGILIAV